MAFCKSCGGPLEGAGRFCVRCGQPVGQPEAVAPETVAPPAAPPTYVPPAYVPPASPPPGAAYQPPQAYAPPQAYVPPVGYPQGAAYPQGAWAPPQKRRSLKWLWISLSALVVVAAVLIALGFTVFKAEEGAGTTPEQTVDRLLKVMASKDLDGVLELMDPSMMEALPTGDALEAARQEIEDSLFSFDSIQFSGIEMSTEETSDTTATVTITKGTVKMTVDGETETEDVSEATEPVTFDVTKIDGKWYVDSAGLF
jgi:hypothetical protein